MSKIKFGNFITYKGKNLKTPQAKAVNGNLVFAEITEGADQGYYIFGGVAEGHLVTMEVFNAVKKEVKELIGAGELAMPKHDDGTYYSIVEYVNSRLTTTLADYKVKDVVVGATSIAVDGIVTLGDAAKKNVATAIAKDSADLATAGQVYDYINAIPEVVVAQGTGISVGSTTADGKTTYTVSVDSTIATKDYVNAQVSKIDGVMEFKGLYEGEQLPTVTAESTDYNPGDVIVWNNKEYVLDKSFAWIEIGQVRVDEAVTSLGNVKGDITLGDGLSMVGQQLTVTFPDELTTSVVGKAAIGVTGVVAGNNTEYEVSLRLGTSGNVTLLQDSTHGLTAHVDAEDLAYTNAKAGATVADVKGALDELYDDKEVVSQALVDLKSDVNELKVGVSGLNTRLNTIEEEYTRNITSATESAPYITFTPTNTDDEGRKDYEVSITIASGESGSTGLVSMGTLESWADASKVKYTGSNGKTTTVKAAIDTLDSELNAHIGSTEAHAAANITYAGATGATATNVEAALDELYTKVEAAALSGNAANIDYKPAEGVTVPEGVDKVNEALDDLYTQLATLGGAAVKGVTGDTASYSNVVSSEDDDQVKIVKNVLADNVVAEDGTTERVHGLVTDEYLDAVLAWEVLAD